MARVFSGMRPTGRLHIGHLVGALNKWIELQRENESFFSIVDWHALTTSYRDTSELNENIYEMLFDWLGVGIDYKKSVIFLQSQVKEHAELYLILSMIVPMPWLERNPTLKSMMQDLSLTNINLGLMGYPVLQTADIIMYKGEKVPVGEDQVPHLEMAREIVRKFNNMYGDIFPEPMAVLTSTPRLLGTDGKKMSKSLNNCIYISDEPEVINKKIWMLITDPEKIHATDPGRPEICSVFDYHKVFNPDEADDIALRCKKGLLGCVPDKRALARLLELHLKEYRERRREFSSKRDMVKRILEDGRERAIKIARETMREVKEAVGLW